MSRRILITGGASGLGLAMARRFARDGARVLVADLDETAGEAAASEVGGVFQSLDVRSDADWERLRERCEYEWGGLDVLVNNAGVAAAGRIERVEMADWEWILDINLKGTIRGCRTFVPLFKRQRSGHVVNMASMAGLMHLPGMASYNVAKAGVISLSKTLRYELAPYGIRTTVVCPSFVKTNLGNSMRSPDPQLSERADRWAAAAKVTADDVAEDVFAAVRDGRFLVITHPEARRTLRLRRIAPWLVDRPIHRMWQRASAKFDRQEDR